MKLEIGKPHPIVAESPKCGGVGNKKTHPLPPLANANANAQRGMSTWADGLEAESGKTVNDEMRRCLPKLNLLLFFYSVRKPPNSQRSEFGVKNPSRNFSGGIFLF